MCPQNVHPDWRHIPAPPTYGSPAPSKGILFLQRWNFLLQVRHSFILDERHQARARACACTCVRVRVCVSVRVVSLSHLSSRRHRYLFWDMSYLR